MERRLDNEAEDKDDGATIALVARSSIGSVAVGMADAEMPSASSSSLFGSPTIPKDETGCQLPGDNGARLTVLS